MMVIKKKYIVLLCLIIMLFVAGYLNWSYKNEEDVIPTISQDENDIAQKNLGEAILVDNPDEVDDLKTNLDNNDDYFLEARMERENSRSESIELLNSIINNENTLKESKAKAEDEIIKFSQIVEKEMLIENLLKAKNFEDAVVFINEGRVNIVVKTDGLIPSQVAQIQDIVMSHTKVSAESINIIEKN